MRLFVIVSMMFISLSSHSQKMNEMIVAGNEAYRKGDFEQAEKQYAGVVKSEPLNLTARYNLANALYRRGKADESLKMYDQLAGDHTASDKKANAFYNKGAILSKSKKLEESIEAYKNALRQNPADKEARENLQKALTELKKKEPPKEKKEDQQKKKQEEQKKEKQQQRPKMSQKEAQQRLDLLEQKEKQVQQRLQKERSASGGGGQAKDW